MDINFESYITEDEAKRHGRTSYAKIMYDTAAHNAGNIIEPDDTVTYIDVHTEPRADDGPDRVYRFFPNGVVDKGVVIENPATRTFWEALTPSGSYTATPVEMFATAGCIVNNPRDKATPENPERRVTAIDFHTEYVGQLRNGPTYRMFKDGSVHKTGQRPDLIEQPGWLPGEDARNLVLKKRQHLDSPYGRDLHPLADMEIMAGELRKLVALAEVGLRHLDEELPPDPDTPATGTKFPGYAARNAAATMIRNLMNAMNNAETYNITQAHALKGTPQGTAHHHLADHAADVAEVLRGLAEGLDE